MPPYPAASEGTGHQTLLFAASCRRVSACLRRVSAIGRRKGRAEKHRPGEILYFARPKKPDRHGVRARRKRRVHEDRAPVLMLDRPDRDRSGGAGRRGHAHAARHLQDRRARALREVRQLLGRVRALLDADRGQHILPFGHVRPPRRRRDEALAVQRARLERVARLRAAVCRGRQVAVLLRVPGHDDQGVYNREEGRRAQEGAQEQAVVFGLQRAAEGLLRRAGAAERPRLGHGAGRAHAQGQRQLVRHRGHAERGARSSRC